MANPNWQKGLSGNPSGRPKQNPEIKAMFDEHLPAAVKAITSCLNSSDEGIRLKAAGMIADRSLGRPAQAVEFTGASPFDNISVNVSTKTK